MYVRSRHFINKCCHVARLRYLKPIDEHKSGGVPRPIGADASFLDPYEGVGHRMLTRLPGSNQLPVCAGAGSAYPDFSWDRESHVRMRLDKLGLTDPSCRCAHPCGLCTISRSPSWSSESSAVLRNLADLTLNNRHLDQERAFAISYPRIAVLKRYS